MISVTIEENDDQKAKGKVRNNGSVPFAWTAECKGKHWVINLDLPVKAALSNSRIEAIRWRVLDELGG